MPCADALHCDLKVDRQIIQRHRGHGEFFFFQHPADQLLYLLPDRAALVPLRRNADPTVRLTAYHADAVARFAADAQPVFRQLPLHFAQIVGD